MTNEETRLAMPSAEKVIKVIEKLGVCQCEGNMSTVLFAHNVEVCKKCNKPIKGWEWEPMPKDICFDKAGHELIVIGINSRKPWIIEVARVYEDGIEMDGEVICPDEVVPFIPWQRIEEILERLGYYVRILRNVDKDAYGNHLCECAIDRNKGHIAKAVAKTRQRAVTEAFLELEKELK